MQWGTFPNTMYEPYRAEAPVVADLFGGTTPAHGLLLGPTGCGKTISAALWSWRLLQHGIAVAVLDARGDDRDVPGLGHGNRRYAIVAAMAAEQGISDGALSWPNGADIDTQVLRYDLTPAAWK